MSTGAQIDRLFEGDRFPTQSFGDLVAIESENPIGNTGIMQLTPTPNDYLIVLTDPRPESDALRETIRSLQTLPVDIRMRTIVVNTDRPSTNRKFLKKNDLLGKVRMFSDESKDCMRAMTALDSNRYSITMFLVANDKIQKLARDVDQYAAAKVLRNAAKSFRESQPF